MAFYTGMQECINSRKNTNCVVTARRLNVKAQNFPVVEILLHTLRVVGKIKGF
jgi:hypothetical protein